MTWLGKILSVLVLLLSLVWMWFTASVYVARTNWKTQADSYKKGFEEARAARESEYRTYLAEKDGYSRQLAAEQTRADGLTGQLAKARADNDDNIAKMADLDKAIKDNDVKAANLAANYQAALDEANKSRARTKTLEDERVALVIAREQAQKDRQAAENLAKQAQGERLLAERRVEELTAQLADARTSGGSPTASVLNSLERRPAPVPEGFRGTVTAARDGYVVLSLGIDAGLTSGATLDIFRPGTGKYLGTVVVDKVYPKEAVAVFKPSDPRRTFKQLRPEETPQVGDSVGRVGSIGATP
jgi:hypothetical protein